MRHNLHIVEERDLIERCEGVVVEGARQHDVLDEADVEVLMDLADGGGVRDWDDLLETGRLLEEGAMVDRVARELGVVLERANDADD